ncbi:hypothetical protein [Streptomyces sp. NPDC058964]|uniref:hypothetical protein n=1 Tax=Streptomyces sp. NPDC058964 TaxID=3346681 RepID=UPI0036C23AA7
MKAVVIDCTLEKSPESSNTGAPAAPGVVAHAGDGINEISGAPEDIGCPVPGQAWAYCHLGPGPDPDRPDGERGRDWAHSTGRTVTDNLGGIARALSERPLTASG